MKELLLSNEFRAYRKQQMNMIVGFLSPRLMNSTGNDLIELKGAIKMAQKVVQLPETLMKSSKDKKLLATLVAEDMKEFQVRFIRSHLIEE